MLRNYFQNSFRSLIKQKVYSALISLDCGEHKRLFTYRALCKHELSYDRFFQDRIDF